MGTPSGTGTFPFTVKVTDSTAPTAQVTTQLLSITIAPVLTLSPNALPNGIVGILYSASAQASGGTSPYLFSLASGTLPPGIKLSSNGGLSGTPTTATGSPFSFAINVADSGNPKQQTAPQSFTISVAPAGLMITTTSPLSNATQSSPYSIALTAANGTGPLSWSISSGSVLPPGLDLIKGVISGTPTSFGTFSFIVNVSDSGTPQQVASATLILNINELSVPIVPSFSFTGIPASQTPGASISGATVSLNPPSSIAWQLSISLGFTPNAAGVSSPYIDPSIQFSNTSGNLPGTISNGTTYTVTVPALATSTPLPQIAPGTVEGQISLTLSVPGQTGATESISVPASVPIITAGSVQILNVTSSGFEVEVIANSSPRDLKTATFSFNAASGTSISGTTSFSVDVSSLMTSWYAGTTSQQYGSAFSLTVPFTFSGNSAAIAAVTVTLTNSVGASSPVTGTN